MIALLRKETEALAPFWVAFGVLVVVNVSAILWDPSFVLEGLGQRFSNGDANAATLWVLSFLVGHGTVAHELRDGHVEFLDALPTGRGQVFAAKLVACLLPVLALVGASLAMDLSLAAIARPPDALSPVQAVLVMHLVMLACGLGGLGAGMLLSWVGNLAWGVLGLTLLTAMCAGVFYPPVEAWLPIIGPFGLLEWDTAGASHPLGPPLGIVTVGVLGAALSWGLFLGPGRLLTERGSQAVAALRLAMVGCLGLFTAPLGVLFGIMVVGYGWFLRAGVEALPTEDFRVLYLDAHRDRAEEVATTVDALSHQVAGLVGNPKPVRLDIELLGAPNNHLGVFTGGKIRLTPLASDATLAHELAHAHAYTLAGDAAWSQHDHTQFFDEGLADWVQANIDGQDLVPTVTGAIHATGQARFEDLVDRQRHLARHDIRQSYALGQAFIASLVAVAGEDAPGCLLRGLGDVGGRPVAGLALWYGLAAGCDIDLDAVQDRWFENMEEARSRIEGPLPRLRAVLVVTEPPHLEVRDELALGWTLLCGFRSDADAPPDRWVYRPAADGVCEVPLIALRGHSFQYQVGYRLPHGGDPGLDDLYLEWTDARRP